MNLSGREGWIAKVSVLSVAGKTLSYEFQNAILSIASTQFCIPTVIAFVDLKKKKKKNIHVYEIVVHMSGKKVTKTDKRVETPWSRGECLTHILLFCGSFPHPRSTPNSVSPEQG